jgi:PKD domain
VDQELNTAWNDTVWILQNWTLTREYYIDHVALFNASTLYTPGINLYDFPLQVGERWWSNGTATGWYKDQLGNHTQSSPSSFQILRTVINQTTVTVPAGTFQTFLVADYRNGGTQLREYRWFSTQAKTSVKVEFFDFYTGAVFDSYVMTSYSLVPTPKPFLAIVNLSPNPVMPEQQVRLDFTATEPGAIVTASWVDWGDGSTPDVIFNMTSGSMCAASPNCAINIGDVVLVRAQDPSTIVDGSIILFRPYLDHPEFLVLHRVVEIFSPANSGYNQYGFVTKGDANGIIDAWVDFPNGIPASHVVGVYQSTFQAQNVPGARYDTHVYADLDNSASRTYLVQVNATDETGDISQASASQTINDPLPAATIGHISASHMTIGTAFSFTVSANDPDGSLTSLSIQWGDGTSTLDNQPNTPTSETHTYNAAGEYIIKIIATDSHGATSQAGTTTITVSAQPSPSAPQPTIFGLPQLVFYGVAAALATIVTTTVAFKTRKKSAKPEESIR